MANDWGNNGIFQGCTKGNPEMFIMDRMSKYSTNLFQTSLFGENFAVFCGASGNKFLFSNEKKYVTSWWPRFLLKVSFSPESLESEQDSIKVRRVVIEFFKPETLQHFIPIMDSMAKELGGRLVSFPRSQGFATLHEVYLCIGL